MIVLDALFCILVVPVTLMGVVWLATMFTDEKTIDAVGKSRPAKVIVLVVWLLFLAGGWHLLVK